MAKEKLTVGNKTIEVESKDLRQADLRFYPENPRVYNVLNLTGAEPTQEEIQEHMCGLDHVKQLKVSIESNGGLIEPLLVRDGDMTVLEGNSRLAAYRLLNATPNTKWTMVKCKVLPSDIDDAVIFALLGQVHIVGRKDWEPFEQAHYLYRRHEETKLPIEYMAKELGITKQKATKMIEVIQFMKEQNDLNTRHWSYYEEYLKNGQIKKYRETSAEIDNTISEAIKSGMIKEASDIRKLGDVAKVGDKQSKRLMDKVGAGSLSIYEAYEEMQESGKLDDAIKRLNAFRDVINAKDFEKQLTVSVETVNAATFEIKKIIKRLEGIQDTLKKL